MSVRPTKIPPWPFGLARTFVLFALLTITIGTTFALRASARHAANIESQEHINNVATAIERRVDAYDELLFGLRGAYVANRQLGTLFSHSAFDEHMRSIEFDRRFPGAQVVGVAPLVERDDLEQFQVAITTGATASKSTYPSFAIYPETDDDLLLPISYVFPVPGNETAFGLDFFSEENRRGAAERARDTGEPAATAPVTLVQETGTQQAFLVMVPLYDTGTTPPTVVDRRRAFTGVVYAAFRMGDLVNGVIDVRASDEVEITSLRPWTSLNAAPSEVVGSTIIYTTTDEPLTPTVTKAQQIVIDVDGQRWGVAARRDFNGALTAAVLPYLILLGGLGLIALLSLAMSSRIRAERANRAKSEFLSRMSHELRTPLNAVIGFSQLLQLEDLKENQQASIHQIEAAGQHLLELVNDVLEISRIESGVEQIELEPVDLRSEAHNVLDLLQTTADEAEIELLFNDEELHHDALGDCRRVRQALLNLSSNAIKYNRHGGTVTMTLWTVGDRVRCQIRDTGIGITPEQELRLFEPFDRLGAEQTQIDGIGLGLMVTKKLIEEMGGRLDLESTPGEGSVFAFELAAGPPSEPSASLSRTSTNTQQTSAERTVLYIEDEPSKQLVMEHIVSPHSGLNLLVADDSSAAEQLLTDHDIDVVMIASVVHGIEAETIIGELRSSTQRPFGLFLVGPDDAEHRSMAAAIEATTLLTLPMKASEVRSLLSARIPAPA